MNLERWVEKLRVNINKYMDRFNKIEENPVVETPEQRISRVADAMIALEQNNLSKAERIKLIDLISRSSVYEEKAKEIAAKRKINGEIGGRRIAA